MADDLLREKLLGNDLEDVQRGGVGRDDDVGGDAGGELLIERDLGVAVLDDGLLNEIGALDSLLDGHGKVDAVKDGLLALMQQALLGEGVQLAVEGGDGLVAGGLAAGPHGDMVAAHGVGLGNAGAHGARAQNGDLFDVCKGLHCKNLLLLFEIFWQYKLKKRKVLYKNRPAVRSQSGFL